MTPLENVDLAIRAMCAGGPAPIIISHTDYWALPEERRQADVYLVLQDETYGRWMAR